MNAMEEFRKEAVREWMRLITRAMSSYTASHSHDVDTFVDYMIENIPKETADPKPRWKDTTDGDTYMAREVGGQWLVWCASKTNETNFQTGTPGMDGVFPSEQKATEALDKWCMKHSNWERCDEAKEESHDEVLAEIKKLREQMGLGVIFGTGDGLWGIESSIVAGGIKAHHTLPKLLDILRKMVKPEPVTKDEILKIIKQMRIDSSCSVYDEDLDMVERFVEELT